MNHKNLLERVLTLHAHYQARRIPTLAQHEVHPGLPKGSRENFLYFTLAPCLNFQRNSPALWRSALATWDDPATRYLFFPEEVAKTNAAAIQSDLGRHKLALQKNKHPEIWRRISETLHDHFHDDPRAILESGGYDAALILETVQRKQKKLFPYLSGPKMANYWLYILSCYTDVRLEHMDAISIIPDTHVIQCSIKLGLVGDSAGPEDVARAWRELLSGTGLLPVDMHPVLWNWSRNGFLPAV
jgi:hypothetical protein